jgi:wobble nucleotide-excising tRNase
LENTEDNSEMICKIWKKIVKLYENYGRKTSRIDKRFEKYRRQLWKDITNMEESQDE